jgi:hypothetical protein
MPKRSFTRGPASAKSWKEMFSAFAGSVAWAAAHAASFATKAVERRDRILQGIFDEVGCDRRLGLCC